MGTTVRGAAAPTSQGADVAGFDSGALDAIVEAVAGAADRWAATTPSERAALLEQVIKDTMAASPAWLEAACEAKGLDPSSGSGGEELFSGISTFVRMAQTFRSSIVQIAEGGRPRFPGPVRRASDGRLVVQVLPANRYDRILFAGTTAEVWIEPGISQAELEADQAPAYRDPESHKGLCLVLGAGNVASLGPRDVLTKIFGEGKVVVLKANPVNDYLIPHWEAAMRALIDAGILAIVDAGAEAGKHLCAHPLVDEVHVTGSDKTYDAIVFGTGQEGARRKAADEPVLDKPVSCELGNVSPVIIVPGEWSEKDLAYQAEHVATMLANNAGFNCVTPRVLITWQGWTQRNAFLAQLEEVLRSVPARRAYYPGAGQRHAAFVAEHPDALELGSGGPDVLPWTLIEDVDPHATDDICFNVEAFCSLLSETALEAESPADFVDKAVEFSNNVLWGTLSATVLAHPSSLKDPVVGPRVAAAIEDLRYGGIGLNLWSGFVFALSTTTWGAYPGHSRADIQSGAGVVGNAFMLTHTQKSVVRGPFRSTPKPAWFVTASNTHATMVRQLAFEAAPSIGKLPGLLLSALRN
jgi:acyl-CoA reductase-like NAD-dependent aldehyde dehydrogenase